MISPFCIKNLYPCHLRQRYRFILPYALKHRESISFGISFGYHPDGKPTLTPKLKPIIALIIRQNDIHQNHHVGNVYCSIAINIVSRYIDRRR